MEESPEKLKDTNGTREVSEKTSQTEDNGAGGGDQDEADVFGTSFYKDKKRRPEAIMPVEKYATFYKMDHKNRGVALILNHENFMSHMKLKARAGTNVDAENLERTLRKIGFEVHVHYDLSVSKVNSVVEAASRMDHSNSDCFLLACLSHGEQNILYANDAPYKPDTLWSQFTADKCPSLAGKPKLFFIQACQGDKLDGGITLIRNTETDSNPSYKIPFHADFLIAYSTVPGYFSWRNIMRGSWFMQALCEKLDKHGFNLDILTLLTLVNQKVAVDFESNDPENSVMHQQKQIPCITFMLIRLLRFTRKEESNDVI